MIDLIVASIMAVVLLVVCLMRAFRPKAIRESVERSAMKFGLAITPEVRPGLLRRRRATWIGYAIGVPIGVELGGLVESVLRLDTTFTTLWLPTGMWLLGGGLGALIGGAVGARSIRRSEQRVARSRAVTVDDYVDPVERRAAWVASILGGSVGVAPILAGERGPGVTAAMVAGAIALLVPCVACGLTRGIVGWRQRADTTVALAWDDALRSDTLRTAWQAAGAIAAFTLTISLPVASIALGLATETRTWQGGTVYGVSALVIAGMIWSMRQHPARHFLRRLWPETAAAAELMERASSTAAMPERQK